MGLKIGIVGFGLNALGWFAEFKLNPKLHGMVEFVGCFDPDPKAKTYMAKVKLPVKQSFEELLSTPGIQCVCINSPPNFHAQQAVAAMEAGLHVYSEVPMAISKEDVEKIVNAQDKNPKSKYMLGENYCFLSEVLYAGQLVSEGKLGPVVYGESEYLHDVTYRWRQNKKGGANSPRINSWYSLFDPLAYAHSIGPAQVAMGGLKTPLPFVEVQSYGNFIGGPEGKPESLPSYAFQVALFKSANDAICKCANAYIFAREPTRLILQVVGRVGTYESYQIGGAGRLFLADDHQIKHMHRVGKSSRIGQHAIAKVVPRSVGGHHGANARTVRDWVDAIKNDLLPSLNAKVAANFCLAGIAASEAARSGKPVSIPDYTSKT